jgi:peptidoglycan/xylan/chitin deacetylase (PgdA/CDA1 family)
VPLTIVMYHYVRDDARVNARTVAELEAQLDHVGREYECLSLDDVDRGTWPDDGCLLTFDDGLAEHLGTVAPALERRGLSGVFCVPGLPLVERRPLDVQKTQFLLAESPDHAALGVRIVELAGAEDEDAFRAANTPAHRYDPPETVFVKRALQDGLPRGVREKILDRLFREVVTEDERAFADDLYLSPDDCRELVDRGHAVIAHGYAHRRLGLLDEPEQARELEACRQLMGQIGGTWALCYPYGSRNETTVRLLAANGCRIALTTDPRRAEAGDSLLELPRIDTNDLQLEVIERTRAGRPVAESS